MEVGCNCQTHRTLPARIRLTEIKALAISLYLQAEASPKGGISAKSCISMAQNFYDTWDNYSFSDEREGETEFKLLEDEG